MITVGKKQILTVVKKVEFGIYLADTTETDPEKVKEKVLLPVKQVPKDVETGDNLTVFVYRDSKDRLIATIREPAGEVGDICLLPVKQVGGIGAFLDWGLEKDLFLPYREQTVQVKPGNLYPVYLYVDKSDRLCATMKLYHHLRTDSSYQKDDRVEGIVYEISDNFGVFVVVDNCFSALIPKTEPAPGLQVGDKVTARITNVREDGKLSLSLREKAHIQMQEDAQKLWMLLEEAGGCLNIGDKSEPAVIMEKTGMSKNEFKRAAGNLYKQRKVRLEKDSITVIS